MHIAEASDAVPNAPNEVRIGQLPPDFVPYSAGQTSKHLRHHRYQSSDGC